MSEESAITRLYRQAIPSVVSVYVTTAPDRAGHGGDGSGFVYDAKHVVTNQHVVVDVDFVELRFADGEWRTGNVVGADPYTDLAVVRVADLPADATPLHVADTNPEPGERVAAIGNPMGLDGTITAGYVSGTNRSSPTGSGFALPETVQTDAAVNPGNSGGPLLTLDGTVVGVNRARAGDNIGFAISPVIVERVVPDLVAEGRFRPAYLNVRTLDVSPTVAAANDLEAPGGVLVVEANGSSGDILRGCDDVARARAREVPAGGDIIVGVDDQQVRSTEELTSYLLTTTRPGDIVKLTIRREGTEQIVTLPLQERPSPDASASGRPKRQTPDDSRIPIE